MKAPAPGTFVRAAVIRGDVTALGVALAGFGLLPAVTMQGPDQAGAGLVVALAGVVLARWGVLAKRALLAEVRVCFADHDPGPSPVPWIGEDLWRARNRFDPGLDAGDVLLAEVDPDIRPFGEDARGAFSLPTLRPVSAAEREATPTGEPLAPAPEPGEPEALLERLLTTPGRFVALEPRWPVCCDRLAVLLATESAGPRPDPVTPLPPVPDRDLPTGEGLHAYRCAICGRAYATDPRWAAPDPPEQDPGPADIVST